MSPGHTTTRTKVMNMLIDSGSWVARDKFAAVTTSLLALEDALADLIVDGQAEFRQNVGYRLAGSVAVRRAAWLQRRRKVKKAVFAEPGNDGLFHVGVAEEMEGVGNVLWEITFPMPPPGAEALEQHVAQVDQVLEFASRKTGGADAGRNL